MAPTFRRAIALWLPAAVGVSLMSGVLYVSVQQSYRQNANDPQLQMAEDAAARLSSGDAPAAVVGDGSVDVATSLAPFVAVYDASGRVLASDGTLDGAPPSPPPGVLQAARDRGQNMVTWQPRDGVRQALEVVPWSSPSGEGTVLAGRSLREVEHRVDDLTLMVGLGWAVTMAAIAVAALIGAAWWGREPEPSVAPPAGG
jgi:hypothetical protein